MFRIVFLSLFPFLSLFASLAQSMPSGPPAPDSLIALSSRIRKNLSYHGVSERKYQRGKETSLEKRIVWQHSSGLTRYRFEKEGRSPIDAVLTADSVFVTRERQSPDKRDRSHRGHYRYSPGHRTFQNLQLIKKNYELTVDEGEAVAGRPTWRLEIRRRSDKRLAERILFDRETGLILARERLNSKSEPIYSSHFISIEYGGSLDPDLFDTSNLHGRTRRTRQEIETETAQAGRLKREFERISFPGGFELVKAGFVQHKGWSVYHASLTDGIRSLSVFACQPEKKDKSEPRYRRWNGIATHKQRKGEVAYTLVGDLGREEMAVVVDILPGKLPLPGPPGRIPRLVALIAFALAVVTLSIVLIRRLL